MKRFSILLVMVLAAIAALAARYEYTFRNTPIAQALTTLIKEHPEAKITFVYNEMDDYTTSAHISTDDLKAAVKAIVARNPISVREKKGHILVEALQKGKYRYSGKLVNEFGDPVPHATVLLLNPKDSVVLTFGISDKEGGFLIPCDHNPVLAKISSTGYETKIMNLSNVSIGSIRFNTKTVELQNVDVVSDLVRMEPDRTVYMPLQRQKNTAINGIDLLEQMGIPQLRITPEGKLETFSGKKVAIFIDFLPADNDDIKTMNLQDVKRVEYLESPADPRFMGERFVVNFIMEKYIYGGYVKLSGYECFNINTPQGMATGRFQYKNMTYDLAAFGDHNDIHHNGTETTETFRFPQPDGGMKTIERLSTTTTSRNLSNTGRMSFKATYSSSDITARTILSAGITDRPISSQSGEVKYTPEEYSNSSYSSEKSSKDKFIQINGSYIFKLPNEFGLTFTPTYTFSQTDQNTIYAQDQFLPILNGADDHTSNLSGLLNLSRDFGKAGSFTAYISGQYDYYRTRYSGSADVYDRTKDQRYKAGASYSISAGGFYGEAGLGWVWDRNRLNDFKSHTSTPNVNLSLSYLIRNIHRVNLGLAYAAWSPNASYKSQAMIEENHLMSYTGNPNLTPCPHMSVDFSYNWIPSNKGNVQVFGSLWKVFDRFVYEYMPDGDRMIRYIRQPMGEYHLLRYGVSGRLYLFNRSLSLNASVEGCRDRNGTPYGYTNTYVDCRVSASYWFKNFYFSGLYSNPATYSDGFMVGDLQHAKSYYYLLAGWANRSWNVRFVAMDFARWNWVGYKQWFTSEYYDRSFLSFDKTRHAEFGVTVTYTFNYGKKLRDERELSTRNATSSGILRN